MAENFYGMGVPVLNKLSSGLISAGAGVFLKVLRVLTRQNCIKARYRQLSFTQFKAEIQSGSFLWKMHSICFRCKYV